jgi:hypothetical protein
VSGAAQLYAVGRCGKAYLAVWVVVGYCDMAAVLVRFVDASPRHV